MAKWLDKYEEGGKLPKDYDKFLEYSKTAPENRRPQSDWEYGNPRQYDHYGMWDALGKPKDFEEALKNNPDWTPNEQDGMYHGFSTNPNTGVWLKSHIPGEKEPGNTAWMENLGFQLSGDKEWNPNKLSLVFDPEIQRMKYIPKKQNGGEMSYYQQGRDFQAKSISRNGDVIKDNLGYWNEDNWGKVVEIDSPHITMKGIKEPLLGISNIGEKKLMRPGKNYHFKGKKVREYPIAEYGINEIHELTDFTNRPSNKKWLNKYDV